MAREAEQSMRWKMAVVLHPSRSVHCPPRPSVSSSLAPLAAWVITEDHACHFLTALPAYYLLLELRMPKWSQEGKSEGAMKMGVVNGPVHGRLFLNCSLLWDSSKASGRVCLKVWSLTVTIWCFNCLEGFPRIHYAYGVFSPGFQKYLSFAQNVMLTSQLTHFNF